MAHIVLTPEQARVVTEAGKPVEVRDPQGNWLGCIDAQEAAIVAELLSRRGKTQKTIPAHKVREHMQALQGEWDRRGSFDHEYMLRLLAKLRGADERRCSESN